MNISTGVMKWMKIFASQQLAKPSKAQGLVEKLTNRKNVGKGIQEKA